MSWPGRRCLVIGGAGNLGGSIVSLLISRGARVRSLDLRPYTGDRADEVESLIGDICNDAAVLEAAAADAEVVFHTASVIDIRPVPSALMTEVNVKGTRLVLEACRAAKVEAVVYTSSVEVASGCDAAGRLRIIEGVDESVGWAPQYPLPYAATKASAEKMVREAHGDALRTVAIRPGYIVGAGCIGLRFELIKAASRGNRYLTARVPSSFSCVHVRNCALAHILAAEQIRSPKVGGRPFFIRDFEANITDLTIQALAPTPVTPVLLPPWLAYALAYLTDRLARVLVFLGGFCGIGYEQPLGVVDVRAADMAWHNCVVSSKRAADAFGYGEAPGAQLVTQAECVREMGEWACAFYKTLVPDAATEKKRAE